MGVAPFPHLLQVLARGEFGVGGPASGRDLLEVVGLLGFRDGAQAAAAQPVEAGFAALREAGINCRLLLATEDGSVGNRGLVTDLLAEHLEAGDCLLVCGPWAMAERVWTLAKTKSGVRTWFSLETGMACGVGSCHGCVIELADGSLARVCHEGPVFPGEIVFGGRSGND
ncbi:MAG: hypothetical protein H5T97_13720 [Firmicutes bacterium]|nr:hypothetical protein [Bacillota bacterium]